MGGMTIHRKKGLLGQGSFGYVLSAALSYHKDTSMSASSSSKDNNNDRGNNDKEVKEVAIKVSNRINSNYSNH